MPDDSPPPDQSPFQWAPPPDQPPPAWPPPPYEQTPRPYGQPPAYEPQPHGQQPSPYDPRSYQQPSANQYWPSQPQNAGTNGLAVASLVLGIVWVFWLGSLLAVIFGHIAMGQIKRSGQSGQGMALAGVILGYIGMAVFAFLFILGVAAGVQDSG